MYIITRSKCKHTTLTFGSGDFYLFCHDCGASWKIESDTGNIGSGATLSGQKRVEQEENK